MSDLSLSGIGVHSGLRSTVRIHEDADPTQPIRFYRNGNYIPALVDYVVSTERTTTLGDTSGVYKVSLVEHILAALYIANRWSGLTIEVSHEELPILDGSAQPWFDLISELNTPIPATQYLKLSQSYTVGTNGGTMKITPSDQHRELNAFIDFEHPAIGQQTWIGRPQEYLELLPARTFVLQEWLEDLHAKNLGLGIREENCAIIKDESDLDKLYRFKNEAVMHKALDALGDLFLLGAPLEGTIEVSRGSHSLHIEFAQFIQQEISKTQQKNEA